MILRIAFFVGRMQGGGLPCWAPGAPPCPAHTQNHLQNPPAQQAASVGLPMVTPTHWVGLWPGTHSWHKETSGLNPGAVWSSGIMSVVRLCNIKPETTASN